MTLQLEILGIYMTDQKTFFRDLGRRLAQLRKEQGMTQGQLAEHVQCSQQTIAEYEAGRMNVPVWRLLMIADALGIGVDDLLKDFGNGSRKRGPASRLEQLAAQAAKLPRTRQRFVIEMLENAVARAQ
jgi:transcriptional regulator with XRE-family HTH domain